VVHTTGATVSEAYITEYSTDTIEMHTGAVQPGQRVLLVRCACLVA
jgi:adenine/guanine phosphoribosyltransferase-like PRPP-binding protein